MVKVLDLRSLVKLSTVPCLCNDPWQVVHIHVPLFTKRHKLVPANGRWCPVAGKVTVGLASHWPCVTDSVVYPSTGSMIQEREMSISIHTLGSLGYDTVTAT